MENKCEPNPCVNGGTCSEMDDDYMCTCREGFLGHSCEGNDVFRNNVNFDLKILLHQGRRWWPFERLAILLFLNFLKRLTIKFFYDQLSSNSWIQVQSHQPLQEWRDVPGSTWYIQMSLSRWFRRLQLWR